MAHAVVEPRKYYHLSVRVLAIDFGQRRIGLAISDRTRTLARPLSTLEVGRRDAVDRVASEVARLAAEDDGLSQIVVGLPVGLDGASHDQTRATERFVAALRGRTPIPIATADERLTSREAEERMAVDERDWRKRKGRLDAAAAAIVLQEYLDRS
jgi:putative Holliday junction resolvase